MGTGLLLIIALSIIMGIVAAKHIPRYDKEYIIILGCRIRKDGNLTPLLKARVDKAMEFAADQEAKTRSYFWINAFIREFIATLLNEKKKHVIILLIFALALFLIQLYVY